MTSIYHILDKHPAIYPEDIQAEYEDLAKKLVNSGRLRIDTDYYRNFVRFSDQANNINVIFSDKELTIPSLIPLTKNILASLYTKHGRRVSDNKLDSVINNLKKNQLKKILPVSDDLKMKLARIFVQSAHPIVIRWLLFDRVEIFITYSHNIGDVMDIASWKLSGTNSGMQSTDGVNACIYVSCGGDPFTKNSGKNPTYGDGWAAAARLQIIAGQEIGHYADIKRDKNGRQITRHSANFACTRAVAHVKDGRRNDIARCDKVYHKLMNNGMRYLFDLEKQLKFYDQNRISGIKVWYIKAKVKYCRYKVSQFARKNDMIFVLRFEREKYMSLMIAAMIEDMKSHLSPAAGVYKRDDSGAEEAIACVEALARIPQQVMKWGYITTKATMHDLYKVYYKEVIPSLIENYNYLTKSNYQRDLSTNKTSILQKISNFFSKIKKDKFKFDEVREVGIPN
ncbi:DUF2748 family protein [Rickettsiaceae bacterium]|nr:DUF2748 family protein [Rickettsiaceae bacterium]